MRDAVKKLAGSADGAVSQFSEPDLLDDLLDHWTSAEHVAERQALVRRLQVRQGGEAGCGAGVGWVEFGAALAGEAGWWVGGFWCRACR